MTREERQEIVGHLAAGEPATTTKEIPSRLPDGPAAEVIIERRWTDGAFTLIERRGYSGDAEDFRLQTVEEELLEGEIPVVVEEDTPAPALEEGGAN